MSGARLLALACGAALGALASRFPVRDSDVFWHLATARAAIEGGLVRSDRFSWSVAGQPVSVDQWLGQFVWYIAYRIDAWRGIVALRAVAVFLLVALIVGESVARRPRQPWVGMLAALPALIVSIQAWTERPLLLGIVCFAALAPLLRRGREGSDRALFAVAPLLVIWANLHGSFALGVGLALLVAIEGALRDPARRRGYAVMAGGALLACVATPAGWGTLATPGFHLLQPPREIVEWTVPDPSSLTGGLWALMLAAVLVTALLAPRPRISDALLLVPLALLSMTAVRHLPLFCIAAAPYLADRAPDALAVLLRRARAAGDPDMRAARVPAPVAAALVAVAALVLSIGAATAPEEPDLGAYPIAALGALPSGAGLLNAYAWGGWLTWYAPATPVFVDGRLVPYLDGVLEDYRSIVDLHPDWHETLARWPARWILVEPDEAIATHARALRWTVRAEGPGYVLFDVPRGD